MVATPAGRRGRSVFTLAEQRELSLLSSWPSRSVRNARVPHRRCIVGSYYGPGDAPLKHMALPVPLLESARAAVARHHRRAELVVGDGQALERVRTELHAEPRAHAAGPRRSILRTRIVNRYEYSLGR